MNPADQLSIANLTRLIQEDEKKLKRVRTNGDQEFLENRIQRLEEQRTKVLRKVWRYTTRPVRISS